MNWLKREPSPERVALDKTVERLDTARNRRKRALQELVRRLDEIPLDDGLVEIGNDMTGVPKGGD